VTPLCGPQTMTSNRRMYIKAEVAAASWTAIRNMKTVSPLCGHGLFRSLTGCLSVSVCLSG
jgi:hypothetical protein